MSCETIDGTETVAAQDIWLILPPRGTLRLDLWTVQKIVPISHAELRGWVTFD
jgi:hypothetical protein